MSFINNLKVYVLAPLVETKDENLNYYYDFSQSIAEYTKVFTQLGINWQWTPVTIINFKQVIFDIKTDAALNNIQPLFFNLCDGDDLNNDPGISVIQYLNELALRYTGANEYFYKITTSKANIKDAFDQHNVANANWMFIETIGEIDDSVFEKISTSVIVKPAVSAGSIGVGVKSVVHNLNELHLQVNNILNGYRGWNLHTGGIILEEFIDGAEFTVLITGNYNKPATAHIYTPVERVFHSSLKAEEKFLSFDRLWEIYEDETPMPNNENFYEYQLPNANVIDKIKQISWDAFVACKGISYARIDIRMNNKTNELLVLEVNAQCGLSDDENYTSIGAILKYSNISFTSLIAEIITNTLVN